MITNTGVEIISKFLVGQANSYASHIAIGCGARPLLTGGKFPGGLVMTGPATYVNKTGNTTSMTIILPSQYYYIQVGDYVSLKKVSTNAVFSGTVTSLYSTNQISINSLDAPTVNPLAQGDSVSITGVAEQSNNELFFKNRLDFEMARFPIKSSSYVIDKKVVYCTQAVTTANSYTLTFTTSSPHNLNIGDKITASGFKTVSGSDINVYIQGSTGEHQYYVIESVPTTTTFTVSLLDFQYSAYTFLPVNNVSAKVIAYIPQISFIAEVSDINQYEITELGLYSSGSNTYSSGSDSRVLLTFGQSESWDLFNGTSVTPVLYTNALESTATGHENEMIDYGSAAYVSASDKFFSETLLAPRVARYEKPRMLGDGLVVSNSLSSFDDVQFGMINNVAYTPSPGSRYIQTSKSFSLATNSDTDELSLAYSIVPNKPSPTIIPTMSRIVVRVMSSNGIDSISFNFYQDEFDVNGTNMLSGNRYKVQSVKLSEGVKTANFSWSDASSVKIFAFIDSSDYSFIFDGLRLENNNNNNPLYGMTAYTGILDASISKEPNTSNLVEFRIEMDVNR